MQIRPRAGRALLGGALAVGAVVGGSLYAGQSHAQIGTCRTDPLFQFSNSHKVQISFVLPTDTATVNSVQSIHYDVHVPADAGAYTVQDSTDPFASKSSWTVYYDSKPSEYKVVASVATNAAPISTSLTQQVVLNATKNGGGSAKQTVNGTTNQYYLVIDQLNAP